VHRKNGWTSVETVYGLDVLISFPRSPWERIPARRELCVVSNAHDHHHHAPANYNAPSPRFALNSRLSPWNSPRASGRNRSRPARRTPEHNLSDVSGLLVAWAAAYLTTVGPKRTPRTYGLRRTSILAASCNASWLLLATGGITWEAVQRFDHPAPVAGKMNDGPSRRSASS